MFILKVLVTGGAGFIGSNFLNRYVPSFQEYLFINADKLTYAANLLNLAGIENRPNYAFEHCDISDMEKTSELFNKYKPEIIIHFAAESHVDRSIANPGEFIQANVVGTFNLLEMCRQHWTVFESKRFVHVSTDEVYGSLGSSGYFTEETKYDPSSPYSASKASSDHLVRAYHRTYGLPVVITNCSNNYGPYQFPEKLIPLIILKALAGEPLPVYGKGENVRDWLYVTDHCEAIWAALDKGRTGHTYNIGGGNSNEEWTNIEVVKKICVALAEETGQPKKRYLDLITFIKDRPGHDLRYAIDSTKARNELGWSPKESFGTGLQKTVRWYLDNSEWVEKVQSGDYKNWLKLNYDKR